MMVVTRLSLMVVTKKSIMVIMESTDRYSFPILQV